MYVAPQLTDLGSFQELTLGASIHAGVVGAAGSLVNNTIDTVGGVYNEVIGTLPGVTVDDNSSYGPGGVTIDPTITITPR